MANKNPSPGLFTGYDEPGGRRGHGVALTSRTKDPAKTPDECQPFLWFGGLRRTATIPLEGISPCAGLVWDRRRCGAGCGYLMLSRSCPLSGFCNLSSPICNQDSLVQR